MQPVQGAAQQPAPDIWKAVIHFHDSLFPMNSTSHRYFHPLLISPDIFFFSFPKLYLKYPWGLLFRNAEQKAGSTLFILSQPAARPALPRVDFPQPAKAFTAQKHNFPQLMTSFALTISFSQGQVWLTYPQKQDSSGSEELPVTPGTEQEAVGSMIYGFRVRAQGGTAPNPSSVLCFLCGTSCTFSSPQYRWGTLDHRDKDAQGTADTFGNTIKCTFCFYFWCCQHSWN